MSDLKINISADASQAIAAFKSTAIASKEMGSALGDARDKVETFRAKLELLNKDALQGGTGKALAKDLSVAKDELKALEQQAGISGQSMGNAFTTAYSGLRKLAYALPGIGVAGLIGGIVAALVEVGTELFNEATAAEFAAKKQEELNAAIGEAQAKTAGDRAEIQSLIAVAGDETLSRDARTNALKELQKQYPNYFGNIKLDKDLTTNLKNATDKLTESILLNAKAKAIQQGIDESAARVVKAATDGSLSYLDKAKVGLIGLFGGGNADASIKAADLATKQYNKTVGEETALQANFSKQLTEVNKQLAVKDEFEKKVPKKGPSADTELNKEIAALNKQISALQELEKQGVATKADIQELFTLKVKKIDLELPKTAFTESQANALKGKIEDDAGKAFAENPLTFKIAGPRIVLSEDTIKFNTNIDPAKFIVIDTDKAYKSAVAAGKTAGVTIKTGLQDGIGKVDIGKGLGSLIETSLANGLENLGVSIGDAISGAGFNSVLKSAENIIGQFIVDFGKLLIESSVETLSIKKAVNALAFTPAEGIAVGIAAVAIGEIIKNASAGPKYKAFAEGGIVTGPTNALIGEAGPEVVFPLAKLQKFIGNIQGGGQHLTVDPIYATVKSGDLHFAWQTSVKRHNRGLS